MTKEGENNNALVQALEQILKLLKGLQDGQ